MKGSKSLQTSLYFPVGMGRNHTISTWLFSSGISGLTFLFILNFCKDNLASSILRMSKACEKIILTMSQEDTWLQPIEGGVSEIASPA